MQRDSRLAFVESSSRRVVVHPPQATVSIDSFEAIGSCYRVTRNVAR
jgi:hypothetical protein